MTPDRRPLPRHRRDAGSRGSSAPGRARRTSPRNGGCGSSGAADDGRWAWSRWTRGAHRSSLSRRGQVAFGQAQFARLQQAAHDLAAAGFGQVGAEVDLLRRHRRAEALAARCPSSSRRRASDGSKPGFSATKALTISPAIGSGLPMTPASATAGCSISALSTSNGPIRWPDDLITSSARPTNQK